MASEGVIVNGNDVKTWMWSTSTSLSKIAKLCLFAASCKNILHRFLRSGEEQWDF